MKKRSGGPLKKEVVAAIKAQHEAGASASDIAASLSVTQDRVEAVIAGKQGVKPPGRPKGSRRAHVPTAEQIEQRARAKKAYENGETVWSICIKENITLPTLYRRLRAVGVKLRSQHEERCESAQQHRSGGNEGAADENASARTDGDRTSSS